MAIFICSYIYQFIVRMKRKGAKPAARPKAASSGKKLASPAVPPVTTSSSVLPLATVALVAAVALIAAYLWHTPLLGLMTAQPWSLARNVQTNLGVPVVDGWSGLGAGSFFAAIADQRSLIDTTASAQSSASVNDALLQASGGGPVPVVLRHTALVERWPALSRWRSPAYLAARPVCRARALSYTRLSM